MKKIASILRRRPWLAPVTALAAVFTVFGWGWRGSPIIVPSLVTIESGAPDAYDVRLQTPLLIDDDRDLYEVSQTLRNQELYELESVDLDDSFMVVTRSKVCAPYRRDARLMVDGDDWWIGERPDRGDITELYNLCETSLVDFHVFEVDRAHLETFADVTRARLRSR